MCVSKKLYLFPLGNVITYTNNLAYNYVVVLLKRLLKLGTTSKYSILWQFIDITQYTIIYSSCY